MKKYKLNCSTHLNEETEFDETYKSTADSMPENFHIFGNIPFNKTQTKHIVREGSSKVFLLGI